MIFKPNLKSANDFIDAADKIAKPGTPAAQYGKFFKSKRQQNENKLENIKPSRKH